jgi:hypothetical protein
MGVWLLSILLLAAALYLLKASVGTTADMAVRLNAGRSSRFLPRRLPSLGTLNDRKTRCEPHAGHFIRLASSESRCSLSQLAFAAGLRLAGII